MHNSVEKAALEGKSPTHRDFGCVGIGSTAINDFGDMDRLKEICRLTMLPSLLDVRGVNLDAQTRCEHYRGPTDIIAIKMKCCGVYYACKDCHAALADHQLAVWPESEWNQEAVLCGACGTELTIRQYMQSEFHCPSCGEPFNPGCRNHYYLYFEAPSS